MRKNKIFLTTLKICQVNIEKSVTDVSHKMSILQLPGNSNCMNWILGHIAVYRDVMLMSIGMDWCFRSNSRDLYAYGSDPIVGDGNCVQLEQILEAINESFDILNKWLEGASNESLSSNTMKDISVFGPKGKSLEENFAHLICHEAIHVGELTPLRELALVSAGKGWK